MMNKTNKVFLIIFPGILIVTFLLLQYFVGWSWKKTPFVSDNDRIVTTFGGKPMEYYSGATITHRGEKYRYPGDTYKNMMYIIRINDDGTTWLMNPAFDKASAKAEASGEGNWAMISLDASIPGKNGKRIRRMYKEAMNSRFYYSRAEGEQFGLKRYVQYAKGGEGMAIFREYLITMKDKQTPLRFIEVTTPGNSIGSDVGGVMHYIMYNDIIQVRIFYVKKYLKDWAHIEKTVIHYIDERFKEAEND